MLLSPEGRSSSFCSSPLAYKKALLAAFLVPPSSLKMIPMISLRQCSGRSFFISEGTFKVAAQSESGGVVTPAVKSFSSFWSSNRDSFGETTVCDLPIRDLRAGGPADYRLLTDSCLLR